MLKPDAYGGIGLFAAEFIAVGARVWTFHPLIDRIRSDADMFALVDIAEGEAITCNYRDFDPEGGFREGFTFAGTRALLPALPRPGLRVPALQGLLRTT